MLSAGKNGRQKNPAHPPFKVKVNPPSSLPDDPSKESSASEEKQIVRMRLLGFSLLSFLIMLSAAAGWYTHLINEKNNYSSLLPVLVFAIGILISFLIFIILYNLSQSEIRASRLALQITKTLRDTEERFRQLAEHIGEVVWLFQPTGEVLYVNPAYEKIWGRPVQDLFANPQAYLDAVVPDDRAEVENALKARDFSGSYDLQYRISLPDGSIRWIRHRGFPIRDSKQAIHRVAGIAEDITEQKKLESQLLQSQKIQTIGTLAGGIAHDLNNQLTPVRGYIDMALSQLPHEHPIYSYLKEAEQAASQCTAIIQRLLSFSRPSAQSKKDLNLFNLLADLKPLLTKFLPSTLSLKIESEENLWTEGNEGELQTVFMNLAANARDAISQTGSLTINAKAFDFKTSETKNSLGHYIYISIHDTGNGIPSEIQSKIFDPFFTTKKMGTGLGLAMVYKIIKDHKGWIEVSSQPGRGTHFQIYLPQKKNPLTASSPPLEEALLKGHGQTLLFADDEERIRNLGKNFLEQLNYHVMTAADGEQALQTYKQNREKIDLILLDMTMPKRGGKETIQELLTINPQAKIIAMSGYTNEGLPEEIIQNGALAFLAKPYSMADLAQVLDQAFKSKR